MDWLTGIQNAINYIEENLTEKIDYDEAAKQAKKAAARASKVGVGKGVGHGGRGHGHGRAGK